MPDGLPAVALAQMRCAPAGRTSTSGRCSASSSGRVRRGRRSWRSRRCASPATSWAMRGEIDALVEDFEGWATRSARRAAGSPSCSATSRSTAPRSARTAGYGSSTRRGSATTGASSSARASPPPLPHGVHPKTLHPNYRFFDDDRHFYSLRKIAGETGTRVSDWTIPYEIPARRGALRLGVQLCEDVWHQDYRDRHETLDTLRAWHRARRRPRDQPVRVAWTWQKNDKRQPRGARGDGALAGAVLLRQPGRRAEQREERPGVRRGHLRVPHRRLARGPGAALARKPCWCSAGAPEAPKTPKTPGTPETPGNIGSTGIAPEQTEIEAIHDAILTGLRHLDHVRGCGNRYLIGVSGGIDSGVVACMLRIAFGPERVFAVNMPTRFNADVTRENARSLCEALGVDYLSCPIEDLYRALSARIRAAGFEHEPGTYTRLVDENVQARIRGSDMLAGIAAKCGLVFTNNGNKTEVALGYATPLRRRQRRGGADRGSLQDPGLRPRPASQRHGVRREVIPRNPHRRRDRAERGAVRGTGRHPGAGRPDPVRIPRRPACASSSSTGAIPSTSWSGIARGRCRSASDGATKIGSGAYFPDARAFVEDLEWVAGQLRASCFKRIQAPPIIVLSKRAFGFDLRESQLPRLRTARLGAGETGAAVRRLSPCERAGSVAPSAWRCVKALPLPASICAKASSPPTRRASGSGRSGRCCPAAEPV